MAATLASEQAAIRRVLAPSSLKFNPDDLVWDVVGEGTSMVVYRGQCANPTKSIPVVGTNPYRIRTDVGTVLSTSRELTQKIEGFAKCPPLEKDTPERRSGGRLYELHLSPGTRYADLKDSLRDDVNDDSHFVFLVDELKAAGETPLSANKLRGMFWGTLTKEKEVLLDLRTIQFVREDGKTPETWVEKPELTTLTEVKKKPVVRPAGVYRTYVVPKAGGRRRTRGRTFRSKTLRRNKHGSRLARQPKRSIRNRHT